MSGGIVERLEAVIADLREHGPSTEEDIQKRLGFKVLRVLMNSGPNCMNPAWRHFRRVGDKWELL